MGMNKIDIIILTGHMKKNTMKKEEDRMKINKRKLRQAILLTLLAIVILL